MTERFVSTRINNRTGCNQNLRSYQCDEYPQVFQTVEYPYESPNYDLMRESHDWKPDQFQPSLLLPQLKRYKKMSGRNDCYINTLNQRSTLYSGECNELLLDRARYSHLIGEGTQDLTNDYDNNNDDFISLLIGY